MSTAESLLKTKGWRRLTDTQRKAYGIADMRYHHTYGYADQRYYVKNGYMIYISDNGNWDYRDPHKVHCVIYGKTNVMTGEYMQKTGLDAGYIEIVD